MDDQNRNLILATALSALVILVWLVLFPPPEVVDQPAPVTSATTTTAATTTAKTSGADTGQAAAAEVAEAARVTIDTPRLKGSILLKGGRFDQLQLLDYSEILNGAGRVTLLRPLNQANSYFVYHGWWPRGGDIGFADVPGANTVWGLESGTTLTPTSPVTLVWDNGRGQIFRRVISVDQDYMFRIDQTVTNNGTGLVTLFPYARAERHGEPDIQGFFIQHEGVVGVIDTQLEEIDYDDMVDFGLNPSEGLRQKTITATQNGWIGFTDKYWMTSLIAQPGTPATLIAGYDPARDIYMTDLRQPEVSAAPGQTVAVTSMLFAGAKEWETIRDYERGAGIAKFVDSIDWGWFFFLTKPMFQLLHFLNALIGNMGLAIIALTLIIKSVLLPLAYKSYVSMARMKELQPEMEKIKERVGDDRQKMQQEMMKLYRDKKVNPASGCLPILLQIPIFFALYKVIFVTLELRHADFALWIRDLSAPDPTSWMNLFGALPWGTPDPLSIFGIISIGVFPVLLGISMWLQQKLNPTPTDPMQAQIFAWMPWVFMFMLGQFASGLVLYWIVNNMITFTQQYAIMRSHGHKPDVLGNILKSFRRKKAGAAK